MSRSYKKHPVCIIAASKSNKKYANKKVRRHEMELPSKGKAYKKIYESYDIIDWIDYWPWSEAKEDWENNKNPWLKKRFSTLQEYYCYWFKCCLSK